MDQSPTKPRGPWGRWRAMQLWKQIFIALGAGVVLGVILNQTGNEGSPRHQAHRHHVHQRDQDVDRAADLRLVGRRNDLDGGFDQDGRIGLKTVVLYLGTTAVAITIGLGLGTILQPGSGIDMTAAASMEAKDAPSFVSTIVNLIPKNPIASAADGNVLQIIVFALLFGLAINLAGEKGKPVRDFFDSMSEVIYKLTAIIIAFAPYGVFALMVWVAGTYGLDLLLPLGAVIGAVYLGCVIHALLVYGGLVKFGAGPQPGPLLPGASSSPRWSRSPARPALAHCQ